MSSMVTSGINFGDYWRNELGTEFRNKALEFVGTYAEKMGTIEMSEDNKHYVATLDVSDVKDTIFPLGVSCNMTTRETCLVAKIVAEGRIGRGKFNMDRHIIEKVTLFDTLNKEIQNKDICIDSLLFLLDFLDSKK